MRRTDATGGLGTHRECDLVQPSLPRRNITGSQDGRQVALYFFRYAERADFGDGLFKRVKIGLQLNATVFPRGIARLGVSGLGLSEAAGVSHDPISELSHEGQMGVASEHDVSANGGSLKLPLWRIGLSIFKERIRGSCVAQEKDRLTNLAAH